MQTLQKEVNDKHWEIIMDKYGKLIHMISHRTYGDQARFSHDDKVSEFHIKIIEVILYLAKKKDWTIEQVLEDSQCNQFIKTSLWNYRSNLIKDITKKKEINGYQEQDTTEEEAIITLGNVPDPHMTSAEVVINDLILNLSEKETELLNLLVTCPNSIKGNGEINKKYVASKLGISFDAVIELIERFEKSLEYKFS